MNDPTPPQAPPAAPAPTVPSPSVPVHPTAPITASQAATMADWTRQDVASGKLSAEQATKIFDDLGVPMDQRTTAADTRTDEHKLVDQHFPPAKDSEYQIRYAAPWQREDLVMTPELKAFDTSARTWLSAAEFPRELGNSHVTAIERVAQQTKSMSADQLENYGLVEYEKLQRAYGDKLEEKLTSAGHMVEVLEKRTPGLKNLLRSKGLGDNALIASMLIGQAERYWARPR